jgi:hypothetical protein
VGWRGSGGFRFLKYPRGKFVVCDVLMARCIFISVFIFSEFLPNFFLFSSHQISLAHFHVDHHLLGGTVASTSLGLFYVLTLLLLLQPPAYSTK